MTYGSVLVSGLLADNVEHTVLEGLLVLGEAVLLPGVVVDAAVQVVPLHAVLEEAKAGPVVGLLLELQLAAVLHVLTELGRVSTAKLLQRSLNLLLLDVVVLFILGATWKSLPWELTLEEVEEDVTDGLQIVSPRLLDTLMRGNGGVSGRSGQVLSILEWDVLALRVLVALGQAEIDDVDVVTSGVLATNEEVIWLDITVDDALFVDLFNAADQLHRDHQNRF